MFDGKIVLMESYNGFLMFLTDRGTVYQGTWGEVNEWKIQQAFKS